MNKIAILSLFIVLICFIGVASAAEDVDDSIAVSDNITTDEVVAEVDSDDESLSVQNNEEIESSDDSNNESLEINDVEEVDDVDDSNSALAAEENENDITGQTPEVISKSRSLKLDSASILGVSNSEKLNKNVFELYVNGSSQDDTGDGKSWETAMGGLFALPSAISLDMLSQEEIKNIDEVIIHLTGNFDEIFSFFGGNYQIAEPRNITFIGHDAKLQNITTTVYGAGNENCTYTFINLTLPGKEFGVNSNFINCTFTGTFSISEDLTNYEIRHIEEYGYAKTYVMNFENCVFKGVTTTDALITLYKYGAANFANCTFENIAADSLVYHNESSYFDDDSISLKECTFTNSIFNGVVDSVANFDDAIIIEDCNYDGKVAIGTTEVNGHFYVNATKLKVVAVDTSINVSSPEKGVVVISLKDNDNKTVVGAKVTYKVNGEDKENVTDANGEIRIALTGEGKITNITYAGNESYKPSNAPDFPYNFTQTTPTPDTNSSTNGTSTNSGNTNTNTNKQTNTKVTKKATKITAKKATFKAKKKSKKYTITLKAGKKAVSKVKVTIKVGKKTYKATTNKKGKATFNLKKLTKKGKYTAVIKFAGNKLYKATTKKVKITVKK